MGAAAAGGRKCKQGAFINSIHFDVGGKLSPAHHFLVSSFILLTTFNVESEILLLYLQKTFSQKNVEHN